MSDVDIRPEQINKETGQKLDKIKSMIPKDKPFTEVGEGCSILCDPLLVDNRLYFGACNSFIYCLNAKTGEKIWNYKTGGQITMSTPIIWKGTLFQCCYDTYLYALDAKTGEEKWKFKTNGPLASSPNIFKEKIYFHGQGDDNHFYCVDARSGELVWKFYCRYGGAARPLFLNGNVLFASTDQNFYCLNAETGDLVWKFFINLKSTATACIIDKNGKMLANMLDHDQVTCKQGSILIGGSAGKLYSLNFNGEKQWEFQTGDRIANSSPLVHNKKIYFTSFDNNVYCLNLDGNVLWKYTCGRSVLVTPVIVDNVLYCGSADQNMYALDPETGQYLWSFHTGGLVVSSIAHSGNKIFFGSWDGNMYCLDVKNKEKVWNFSTGSLAQSTLFGINLNSEEDRIRFAIHSGVDRDLAYKIESNEEHERVGFNPYLGEDEKNPYVAAGLDRDNPYNSSRRRRSE